MAGAPERKRRPLRAGQYRRRSIAGPSGPPPGNGAKVRARTWRRHRSAGQSDQDVQIAHRADQEPAPARAAHQGNTARDRLFGTKNHFVNRASSGRLRLSDWMFAFDFPWTMSTDLSSTTRN